MDATTKRNGQKVKFALEFYKREIRKKSHDQVQKEIYEIMLQSPLQATNELTRRAMIEQGKEDTKRSCGTQVYAKRGKINKLYSQPPYIASKDKKKRKKGSGGDGSDTEDGDDAEAAEEIENDAMANEQQDECCDEGGDGEDNDDNNDNNNNNNNDDQQDDENDGNNENNNNNDQNENKEGNNNDEDNACDQVHNHGGPDEAKDHQDKDDNENELMQQTYLNVERDLENDNLNFDQLNFENYDQNFNDLENELENEIIQEDIDLIEEMEIEQNLQFQENGYINENIEDIDSMIETNFMAVYQSSDFLSRREDVIAEEELQDCSDQDEAGQAQNKDLDHSLNQEFMEYLFDQAIEDYDQENELGQEIKEIEEIEEADLAKEQFLTDTNKLRYYADDDDDILAELRRNARNDFKNKTSSRRSAAVMSFNNRHSGKKSTSSYITEDNDSFYLYTNTKMTWKEKPDSLITEERDSLICSYQRLTIRNDENRSDQSSRSGSIKFGVYDASNYQDVTSSETQENLSPEITSYESPSIKE